MEPSKSKQYDKIGVTLSSLGGLLVIFNLTIWKESEWGLVLAVIAVVIILAGLYLSSWTKKNKVSE